MTNTEKTNDAKQFGAAFILLGNDRASQDKLIAAMIRLITQGVQSIAQSTSSEQTPA